LSNGVATQFTIQYGRVNGRRVAYRHGHCEKCAPEYAHGRRLHPIPPRSECEMQWCRRRVLHAPSREVRDRGGDFEE
jgi:hypothetical protein